MGAECVALFGVHGMLEDGAEDVGGDVGPIIFHSALKLTNLIVEQFDGGGLGEDAAVEIGDGFESTAAGAVFGGHCVEETAEEVEGLGRVGAFFYQVGDEVLRQEADVLGEEGDEHLEDEALGKLGADLFSLGEFGVAGGEFVGGLARDF